MLQLTRQLRQRSEEEVLDEGFTLIELLVVLLIIGILLAIAIPTFLSVTKSANNTAAQSNLQTALTGTDTFYTQNNQSYESIASPGADVSSLTQIDTGITYEFGTVTPGPAGTGYTNGGVSNASNEVGVASPASQTSVLLYAYAPGTTDCWYILDNKATQANPLVTTSASEALVGTFFGGHNVGSSANCTAANGETGEVTNWSTTGFPKM